MIVAPEGAAAPEVYFMRYDAETLEEGRLDTPSVGDLRTEDRILWVDVCGLGDAAVVEAVGAAFGLHPLALEDVVNPSQRAKTEEYESSVFLIIRRPSVGDPGATEQVSVFFGEDFVVTFRERDEPWLEPIRKRLHAGRPLRGHGADYLAYAVVDAAIDHAFPVAELYGDRIDRLEETVLDRGRGDTAAEIQTTRHDLLQLRRALSAGGEAIGRLTRAEAPFVRDETRIYLRDCHDHALRGLEVVDGYRELAGDLMDLHLASLGHRTNEVMKTLTIIATLFIPLSFVAGLYGMNFDPEASPWNMPELGWYWGYPAALGLMAAVTASMLLFLKRKGWIGRPPDRPPSP